MNRDVAAGAFAAGLKTQPAVGNARRVVKSGVTLQAELASFTPNQKHSVRAAVRRVAGRAAQYLHRSVLVNVRPALLLVAIQATEKIRPVQAGAIQRAVRAMAIGALDQTLRDPMMYRQRELCLNRAVTTKAQRWFGLLQQAAV